jgi:hypothetical protein
MTRVHSINLSIVISTPRTQPPAANKCTARAFCATTFADPSPSTERCRPVLERDIQTQLEHGGAAQMRPPGLTLRSRSSERTNPEG